MADVSGIILAAGHGKRMKSSLPKVLHPILGRPMLDYPVLALEQLGCKPVIIVIGAGAERVRETFETRDVSFALQDPPRGTGDATLVGLRALPDASAPTCIVNGDLPLLSSDTLRQLHQVHMEQQSALTFLTLQRSNPEGYGRIVRDEQGMICAVVEEADASEAQRQITEVNAGVYVADAGPLRAALEALEAHGAAQQNSQGELYLPPAVGPLRELGLHVASWKLPRDRWHELQQVNNRVELSMATRLARLRVIERHQLAGVTIVDPATTYIDEDVVIGADTVIQPCTVITRGVRIGRNCEVGPFAHLRVDTCLEDGAEVGNFTELKKTRLGRGSKAKHLSYLGDGDVGEDVNIGAGTIFANYDGTEKNVTKIEDGAFVGSGTILVAPVTVGRKATTGAGAVVIRGRDVAPGETVVGVPARRIEKDE